MFLAFKNGVKSIQIAGYNGARTVLPLYFITWNHANTSTYSEVSNRRA